ncbi:MAG: hypothetical protein K6L75_05160 [Cellvibrionaceae bacterium]
MEFWEHQQLSRAEIDRMREEVKHASAQLDNARRKLTEGNITFQYPNADLLIYLEKTLREYSGYDLHPENLPDNIVFFLWLCFGSFVEGESRFNYTAHREERMNIVGNMIIRASCLQKKTVLERACEYYDLLLTEADKRRFYIPPR